MALKETYEAWAVEVRIGQGRTFSATGYRPLIWPEWEAAKVYSLAVKDRLAAVNEVCDARPVRVRVTVEAMEKW